MKEETGIILLAVLAIGAFYYFAIKKPSLSVKLVGSDGNLAAKGTKENPVTSADIQSVSTLLIQLIELKEKQ